MPVSRMTQKLQQCNVGVIFLLVRKFYYGIVRGFLKQD